MTTDEIQKEFRSDPDSDNGGFGIGSEISGTEIKFSWDGKFVAVYSSSFPTNIWIWDLSSTKLAAVLSQIMPIAGTYY